MPKSTPTEFRLLFAPLTRSVYAGRAKELCDGLLIAVGQRHDVTDDFLGVVIQYAERHGGAE